MADNPTTVPRSIRVLRGMMIVGVLFFSVVFVWALFAIANALS